MAVSMYRKSYLEFSDIERSNSDDESGSESDEIFEEYFRNKPAHNKETSNKIQNVDHVGYLSLFTSSNVLVDNYFSTTQRGKQNKKKGVPQNGRSSSKSLYTLKSEIHNNNKNTVDTGKVCDTLYGHNGKVFMQKSDTPTKKLSESLHHHHDSEDDVQANKNCMKTNDREIVRKNSTQSLVDDNERPEGTEERLHSISYGKMCKVMHDFIDDILEEELNTTVSNAAVGFCGDVYVHVEENFMLTEDMQSKSNGLAHSSSGDSLEKSDAEKNTGLISDGVIGETFYEKSDDVECGVKEPLCNDAIADIPLEISAANSHGVWTNLDCVEDMTDSLKSIQSENVMKETSSVSEFKYPSNQKNLFDGIGLFKAFKDEIKAKNVAVLSKLHPDAKEEDDEYQHCYSQNCICYHAIRYGDQKNEIGNWLHIDLKKCNVPGKSSIQSNNGAFDKLPNLDKTISSTSVLQNRSGEDIDTNSESHKTVENKACNSENGKAKEFASLSTAVEFDQIFFDDDDDVEIHDFIGFTDGLDFKNKISHYKQFFFQSPKKQHPLCQSYCVDKERLPTHGESSCPFVLKKVSVRLIDIAQYIPGYTSYAESLNGKKSENLLKESLPVFSVGTDVINKIETEYNSHVSNRTHKCSSKKTNETRTSVKDNSDYEFHEFHSCVLNTGAKVCEEADEDNIANVNVTKENGGILKNTARQCLDSLKPQQKKVKFATEFEEDNEDVTDSGSIYGELTKKTKTHAGRNDDSGFQFQRVHSCISKATNDNTFTEKRGILQKAARQYLDSSIPPQKKVKFYTDFDENNENVSDSSSIYGEVPKMAHAVRNDNNDSEFQRVHACVSQIIGRVSEKCDEGQISSVNAVKENGGILENTVGQCIGSSKPQQKKVNFATEFEDDNEDMTESSSKCDERPKNIKAHDGSKDDSDSEFQRAHSCTLKIANIGASKENRGILKKTVRQCLDSSMLLQKVNFATEFEKADEDVTESERMHAGREVDSALEFQRINSCCSKIICTATNGHEVGQIPNIDAIKENRVILKNATRQCLDRVKTKEKKVSFATCISKNTSDLLNFASKNNHKRKRSSHLVHSGTKSKEFSRVVYEHTSRRPGKTKSHKFKETSSAGTSVRKSNFQKETQKTNARNDYGAVTTHVLGNSAFYACTKASENAVPDQGSQTNLLATESHDFVSISTNIDSGSSKESTVFVNKSETEKDSSSGTEKDRRCETEKDRCSKADRVSSSETEKNSRYIAEKDNEFEKDSRCETEKNICTETERNSRCAIENDESETAKDSRCEPEKNSRCETEKNSSHSETEKDSSSETEENSRCEIDTDIGCEIEENIKETENDSSYEMEGDNQYEIEKDNQYETDKNNHYETGKNNSSEADEDVVCTTVKGSDCETEKNSRRTIIKDNTYETEKDSNEAETDGKSEAEKDSSRKTGLSFTETNDHTPLFRVSIEFTDFNNLDMSSIDEISDLDDDAEGVFISTIHFGSPEKVDLGKPANEIRKDNEFNCQLNISTIDLVSEIRDTSSILSNNIGGIDSLAINAKRSIDCDLNYEDDVSMGDLRCQDVRDPVPGVAKKKRSKSCNIRKSGCSSTFRKVSPYHLNLSLPRIKNLKTICFVCSKCDQIFHSKIKLESHHLGGCRQEKSSAFDGLNKKRLTHPDLYESNANKTAGKLSGPLSKPRTVLSDVLRQVHELYKRKKVHDRINTKLLRSLRFDKIKGKLISLSSVGKEKSAGHQLNDKSKPEDISNFPAYSQLGNSRDTVSILPAIVEERSELNFSDSTPLQDEISGTVSDTIALNVQNSVDLAFDTALEEDINLTVVENNVSSSASDFFLNDDELLSSQSEDMKPSLPLPIMRADELCTAGKNTVPLVGEDCIDMDPITAKENITIKEEPIDTANFVSHYRHTEYSSLQLNVIKFCNDSDDESENRPIDKNSILPKNYECMALRMLGDKVPFVSLSRVDENISKIQSEGHKKNITKNNCLSLKILSSQKPKEARKYQKHNFYRENGRRCYPCVNCNRIFSNSGDLRRHFRTHSGEKPYKCSLCTKTYRQRTALKCHMVLHRGDKSYVCQICGISLSQKAHLISHFRTHTGEKPFRCKTCGKGFARKDLLNSHSLIHDIARPFKCQICSGTFKSSANLNVHMKHHRRDRRHKCIYCSAAFVLLSDLKRHKKIHDSLKVCPSCGKCFNLEVNLRRHLKMANHDFIQ